MFKIRSPKFRADNYCPPLDGEFTTVEPELLYKNRDVASGDSLNSIEVCSEPSRQKSIQCFNCKKLGHFARNCRNKFEIHCFKCQKPGFTVKTCTSCNKAEKKESQLTSKVNRRRLGNVHENL